MSAVRKRKHWVHKRNIFLAELLSMFSSIAFRQRAKDRCNFYMFYHRYQQPPTELYPWQYLGSFWVIRLLGDFCGFNISVAYDLAFLGLPKGEITTPYFSPFDTDLRTAGFRPNGAGKKKLWTGGREWTSKWFMRRKKDEDFQHYCLPYAVWGMSRILRLSSQKRAAVTTLYD